MSKIIAIGGVSGSGKTTVVNALINRLDNAAALYFDDYNFDEYIEYSTWIKNGGDYNAWDLLLFKNNIDKLIGQKKYILLDYPFAYKNNLIGAYIDTAIYIDTPLDAAMARRIFRDMANASGYETRKYIENYIKYERPLYQYMIDNIKSNSDIVVDGLLAVHDIINEIWHIFK